MPLVAQKFRFDFHSTVQINEQLHYSFETHLISEDPDGACSGHLIRPEPHRCDARGHPENKHLSHGAHELTHNCHGKKVRSRAGHLDPRARAIQSRGHERDDPQTFFIQEPRDGENERNVRQHVNHGHPVNGERVHAVEAHEDIVDDPVLNPLIRVTQRI